MPELIVRADAGSDIGLGHLVRSVALAQAWQDAGGTAVLATTLRREELPASIASAQLRIVRIESRHPDPADIQAMEGLVAAARDPWVSCDGYGFDAHYTRRLRHAGARVLVIDDRADQPVYHADVLLNQNLGAEHLSYRFDTNARSLLGPRFALLPRAFARWRGWSRVITDKPACLLLTVGGSSTGDAADKIVRGVVRFLRRHPMRAVVLAGPGDSASSWSDAVRVEESVLIEIVSNPADVPALMAAADMAVSAAGSTTWQLCFMGAPAVLTTVAENQAGIAQRLQEAGCAVDIGWRDGLDERRVADALDMLFCDSDARARMSQCGQQLVDGMGAARIVEALSGSQEDANETV